MALPASLATSPGPLRGTHLGSTRLLLLPPQRQVVSTRIQSGYTSFEASARLRNTEWPKACTRRHANIAAAVVLLFIPWRGCTEGGFYDTGVTENCQKIYQPAAAAEDRLKRRLAGEDVPPLTTRRAVNRTQGSALTGESERDVLLAEQKSYDRVAIEAEKAKQTKALVDNMWQGLE